MVIKQTGRIRLKANRQVHAHTRFSSAALQNNVSLQLSLMNPIIFYSQPTTEMHSRFYPVMAIGWTWITTGRHLLLCRATFRRALMIMSQEVQHKTTGKTGVPNDLNNWLITRRLHLTGNWKRKINIITRSLHNPNSNPRQTQSPTSTQCSRKPECIITN